MKFKRFYTKVLLSSAAFVPVTTLAAAGDPTTLVQNLTNKFITFFMVSAPSIATVALMALGTMYKMTTDAHKKSEYKGHMKSTLIVTVFVLSAGAIVKWFLN